jgi:putative hemolysin
MGVNSMKRTAFTVLFVVIVVVGGMLAACQKEEEPGAEIANPASVYCEENGGKLEIREGEGGGQIGVCVFEDGSECEEWAYYREECAPGDSLAPAVEGDEVVGDETGMDTDTPEMDTVTPEVDAPAEDEVADWQGVIVGTEQGAEYDDAFERQGPGEPLIVGIDSIDPEVRQQIIDLRDTGVVVRVWGTLLSDVPDVNGAQIAVDRIEVVE